jgi:hypothetical protein
MAKTPQKGSRKRRKIGKNKQKQTKTGEPIYKIRLNIKDHITSLIELHKLQGVLLNHVKHEINKNS